MGIDAFDASPLGAFVASGYDARGQDGLQPVDPFEPFYSSYTLVLTVSSRYQIVTYHYGDFTTPPSAPNECLFATANDGYWKSGSFLPKLRSTSSYSGATSFVTNCGTIDTPDGYTEISWSPSTGSSSWDQGLISELLYAFDYDAGSGSSGDESPVDTQWTTANLFFCYEDAGNQRREYWHTQQPTSPPGNARGTFTSTLTTSAGAWSVTECGGSGDSGSGFGFVSLTITWSGPPFDGGSSTLQCTNDRTGESFALSGCSSVALNSRYNASGTATYNSWNLVAAGTEFTLNQQWWLWTGGASVPIDWQNGDTGTVELV